MTVARLSTGMLALWVSGVCERCGTGACRSGRPRRSLTATTPALAAAPRAAALLRAAPPLRAPPSFFKRHHRPWAGLAMPATQDCPEQRLVPFPYIPPSGRLQLPIYVHPEAVVHAAPCPCCRSNCRGMPPPPPPPAGRSGRPAPATCSPPNPPSPLTSPDRHAFRRGANSHWQRKAALHPPPEACVPSIPSSDPFGFPPPPSYRRPYRQGVTSHGSGRPVPLPLAPPRRPVPSSPLHFWVPLKYLH